MSRRFKLTPLTHKGRNTVNNHGSIWYEVAEPRETKWGLARLVHSERDDSIRWVNVYNDEDFIVDEVTEPQDIGDIPH